MLFSSPIFLFIFLPIVLLLYYLLDRKFKNYLLLIASIIFYAWGEPKFVIVMIFSVLVNYVFGLLVDKFRENKIVARICIGLMCLLNISIFFVYKYLNFVITNINGFFSQNIPLTEFVLPIGISFFTFQAMSYVIDVYRKDGKVQKNPLNVLLYVTFFPQLIAGPIVRYQTVADEINNRKETLDDFVLGIKRFTYGLCKKLILSNAVAVIADQAFNTADMSELSVAMAWLGALCYSLQIFFDFAGYSDMAIGLGLMFGFHFNENFNYPYISASVSEFWRRWHISLGSWFRDYVYFPLGGSRVDSKFRLIFNLFVVWFLTGVWHGANWTFIAWGLLYFVILTFEKLAGIPKDFQKTLPRVLYRIFTLLCVMFGWVLFRAESIEKALQYMAAMFGGTNNAFFSPTMTYTLKQYAVLIIVSLVLCTPIVPFISKKIKAKTDGTKLAAVAETGSVVLVMVLLIIAVSYAVSVSFNPFIYFNF